MGGHCQIAGTLARYLCGAPRTFDARLLGLMEELTVNPRKDEGLG